MRRGMLLCILSQAKPLEAENNQIPAVAQKSKRLGLKSDATFRRLLCRPQTLLNTQRPA
jgi:hypothetical protein